MAKLYGTNGDDINADYTDNNFLTSDWGLINDSVGDEFFSYDGEDRVDAGSGDDIIHGDDGNDTLSGGGGFDDLLRDEANVQSRHPPD